MPEQMRKILLNEFIKVCGFISNEFSYASELKMKMNNVEACNFSHHKKCTVFLIKRLFLISLKKDLHFFRLKLFFCHFCMLYPLYIIFVKRFGRT